MTTYDAIVIGTGFGGAVASCRLAQAKLRVCILERGRRYDGPNAFPRDFGNVANGWLWAHNQGLFDVKPIEEMFVVESAGYGGGSLIYANVHLRPVPDVFASGWPRGYDREALDPYYDLVAYMLDIRPITDAAAGLPPKAKWMKTAAEKLGRGEQFYYPNLAVDLGPAGKSHQNKHGVEQAGCTYCGECDIGCNARAKNTLDLNYLALAERAGAEVRTQSQAIRITPSAEGYVVAYKDHHEGGVEKELQAKAVFVCGGAVNSTELLLRCRDEHRTLPHLSDALGKEYSGNGDFLAFAFDAAEPFEPNIGPTITSALIYDQQTEDVRSWFTLQEGGYPKQIAKLFQLLRPGAGAFLAADRLVREELERELRAAASRTGAGDDDRASRSAVFLAMGRDRARGRIELHPVTRSLRIRWDLADNLPLYGAEARLARDIVEKMGGTPANQPFWELFKQPVSVHNLGGCCMGDDPSTGVVDGNGEVFGHPNLFVLDGASLPAATGVNPSHTIAAVAERNVEAFIRRRTASPWVAPERSSTKPVRDPITRIRIPTGGTAATATAPLGLRFTETMKGFFVPADRQPADLAAFIACEHEGQRKGSTLDFTLTITLTDLDVFLNERSHTGVAVGKVHAAPYAPQAGADVTIGVFNLFVAGDSPDSRRMLYSLPFDGADGQRYLLDGFKDVRDHGHFDVWGATSTLYTVIRKGSTHDAPVCAAGVLHILIPDFLHQLTTFRIIGVGSNGDRLGALNRFGRMFGGSLWDVFIAPKVALHPA